MYGTTRRVLHAYRQRSLLHWSMESCERNTEIHLLLRSAVNLSKLFFGWQQHVCTQHVCTKKAYFFGGGPYLSRFIATSDNEAKNQDDKKLNFFAKNVRMSYRMPQGMVSSSSTQSATEHQYGGRSRLSRGYANFVTWVKTLYSWRVP